MMYRYPREGLISGVCVSLAKQSGVQPWIVRSLMLLVLLAGGYIMMPLIYIAATLLIEKAPDHYYLPKNNQTFDANNFFSQKGWQIKSPHQITLTNIQQQLDNGKKRTQQLENYIKSTHFRKNW